MEKLTKHKIDGDKKLSFYQKFVYLYFFIKEIILEKKIYNNFSNSILNKEEFLNFINFKSYNELIYTQSPTRIGCNYFLLNFLKLNYNVNERIDIIDVGCGNGKYYEIFNRYFNNFDYYGFDTIENKNWSNYKNSNINFIKYSIGNDKISKLIHIKNNLKNKNCLIFSQSVLEHIEYDLTAIKQLSDVFSHSKQLHLLPGAFSFLNYLKHGYRRYIYKDFIKLEKMINRKIYITKIGGYFSFKFYFNFYEKNLKKKHPLNFFKVKDEINSQKIVEKIIFENEKTYSLFYAIEIK